MLRLVGVTIPDDVDLFNGLKMIKGLDTKNSEARIETILTKAGLYTREIQRQIVKDKNGNTLTHKECFKKVYPKVGDLTWKQKSRLIDILEMPKAVLRNIHTSPKKLRLIANEVRGKNVDEALAILEFIEKGGAPTLLKLLKSAIANAGNNHGLRADDLYVAKFMIDGAATMKRFMPRARGRACRIRCRTSHATIVLRERFQMAKFAPAKPAETTKATKAKKATKKVAAKPAEKAQGGNE